ncbi:MAG: glycosyltransferase family 4 protein [Candidatus Sumerlaeia bacterium]|nr:glycosyltransferase family 4 protein [Candidatus Sumerlaeia bacterium]
MSNYADAPVYLDARMIGHSGIGAHIRGLLEGWRESVPDFRPLLLGDPATLAAWLPDADAYTVIPYRARPYGIGEQWSFPARSVGRALLHVPHYNVPFSHRGPLVVTVHDLIHLHPQWGTKSALARLYAHCMLRTAARRAAHILTVSRATADALTEQLGVAPDRISVIYNAAAKCFHCTEPSPETLARFRRDHQLPDDYILTVGLYKPHKNIDGLLDAFCTLRQGGQMSLSLVVAGTQTKERPALLEALRRRGLTGNVCIVDRLPSGQMPLLYCAARALVHPALLEGFGLPVIEAQAVGTPVAASKTAAVAEIAGDGALLFDPLNVEEMARQIKAVVCDSAVRARLAERGRKNARRFSWSESAAKVRAVYERLRRGTAPSTSAGR